MSWRVYTRTKLLNNTRTNKTVSCPQRKNLNEECSAGFYLLLDVYFVTALVPSLTACFANSPGKINRTAVWISRELRVDFLLYEVSLDASDAIHSKISFTNEFMIFIAVPEMPVSGCTCSNCAFDQKIFQSIAIYWKISVTYFAIGSKFTKFHWLFRIKHTNSTTKTHILNKRTCWHELQRTSYVSMSRWEFSAI